MPLHVGSIAPVLFVADFNKSCAAALRPTPASAYIQVSAFMGALLQSGSGLVRSLASVPTLIAGIRMLPAPLQPDSESPGAMPLRTRLSRGAAYLVRGGSHIRVL